ncbi:hypothetical protein HK097_001367 [Rhizophlyctis rosea]|uniref:Pentacotripeptide-repeat region of PRORP domain-containing protein n=1 Tax=Rhizophlyctis rosea TaxID=64517 RepID=A0AAD5SGY4_9FUNG|nr:hypothetical protein HK097_001367 [Rhizophlyctis rosea]
MSSIPASAARHWRLDGASLWPINKARTVNQSPAALKPPAPYRYSNDHSRSALLARPTRNSSLQLLFPLSTAGGLSNGPKADSINALRSSRLKPYTPSGKRGRYYSIVSEAKASAGITLEKSDVGSGKHQLDIGTDNGEPAQTLRNSPDVDKAQAKWEGFLRAYDDDCLDSFSDAEFCDVLNALQYVNPGSTGVSGWAQRVLDDMVGIGRAPQGEHLLLALELHQRDRNREAVRNTFNRLTQLQNSLPGRAFEIMIDIEGRDHNGGRCDELLKQMEESQMPFNPQILETCAYAFIRARHLPGLKRCCDILDTLSPPNLDGIYERLLLFGASGLKGPETMSLFERMALLGFSPKRADFNRILRMFGKLDEASSAARVWESMDASGFRPDISTYEELSYLAKGGTLDLAIGKLKEGYRGGSGPDKRRLRVVAERMFRVAGKDKRFADALKCYDLCIELGVYISDERVQFLGRSIAVGALAHPDRIYLSYAERKVPIQPPLRRSFVKALLENGDIDLASECFLTLQKGHAVPHDSTCRHLLESLGAEGFLEEFEKCLAHLVELGIVLPTAMSNRIIESLRRRLGTILRQSVEAERASWSVFKTMREWQRKTADAAPDGFTYELLFSDCHELLDTQAAVEVLKSLDNQIINRFFRIPTFASAVNTFIKASRFEEAHRWILLCHVAYPEAQFPVSLYTTLITHFLENDNLAAATKLYDSMESRKVRMPIAISNLFLRYYAQKQQPAEVQQWERRVSAKSDDTGSSLKDYTTLISAAARRQDLDAAIHHFEQMQAKGIKPDVWAHTAVIGACVAVNNIHTASAVFDEMKRLNIAPSAMTYETLISGYARRGRFAEVDRYLSEMREMGFDTSTASLHRSLLYAYAESHTGKMWTEFQSLLKHEKNPSLPTMNVLMNGYAKRGDLAGCDKVMAFMRHHNYKLDIRTWTNYMEACARTGDYVAMGEVWHKLIKKGPKPDAVLIGVAVKGVLEGTELQQGRRKDDRWELRMDVARKFLERAVKHEAGIVDVGSFNHVVEAYARVKDVPGMLNAVQWMESLKKMPNGFTWCTVMEGCSSRGEALTCVDIFGALQGRTPSLQRARMRGWNVKHFDHLNELPPAAISVVLDACGFGALLPNARKIWLHLVEQRYPLNSNHLTSFAECLVRCGRFTEAADLVEFAERPDSGLPKPEVKTFVNIISMLVSREKWEDAMRVWNLVEARKGKWGEAVKSKARKALIKLASFGKNVGAGSALRS